MKLFNKYCGQRTSSSWVVRLEKEDVKEVESDGFSIRSNLAAYWPPKKESPAQLLVLKQRWEDYSHLL